MARIPEEVIDRLKSEVSLLRLLESQGYELKPAGKDYLTRCPFHEDDTASLVITPPKNLFNCFGCGAGGTVIDWTMKTQGISFRHAVEWLSTDPTVLATKNDKPVHRSRSRKLDAPFERDSDDQSLLNRVVNFYHQTLKQSPDALAYCEQRGISADAIDYFKLGFANRSLGYRLPNKQTVDGEAIRSQLQRIGILRESGHEHFNGSLVIPVIDEHARVQEVYGRKIGDRLRKGTPLHLYLPGPHQGIFNLPSLAANKEIILCESLIDALTFWCNGFKHVTTSYGTQGFTDELLKTFKQNNIERVLIAYDRDEAGNTAAEALAKKLNAENIDCYRVLFPKDMDANAYAMSMQPARKSLELVIRKAEWIGKGKKHTEDRQQQTEEKKNARCLSSEPSALPASPIPQHKRINIDADIQAHEVNLAFADRRYRVRGLQKNSSYEQLKINLCVHRADAMHIDNLDLYSAKQRDSYIKQAAIELDVHHDVIKADLGKVLLKLEHLQDANIQQALAPTDNTIHLNNEEQQAALEFLTSADLLNRVLQDFETCGIVGEQTNKLAGYLACVSRKLERPLAIIVQSTSAAGKSSLMDAVLNLMPEEDRVQYAAMTGQSLFYMGETDLKHKILAIVEEEGAHNASYALKLLQSEGELTIASTGKDDVTGNLVTKEYRVEGPVMLFLTTTAIDIDEELLNRCLVLTVNEDREQTQAIHAQQRKKRTLEGLLQKQQKNAVLTLHRNAQRLLKPLHVVNPFAEQLTFLDDKTRTRRDHEKYLTLIESITLLHQHQRQIKTVTHNDAVIEYIEVTLSDIEIANQLAHELLGRTLDELPPQTRKLLKRIYQLVSEQCKEQHIEQSAYHFSRRELREFSAWGNTQLGVHLDRLVKMEYVLLHRSGRGQSFVYELLYDGGQRQQPHLSGLIDIAALKSNTTTPTVRGQKQEGTGLKRPANGVDTEVNRGNKNTDTTSDNNHLVSYPHKKTKNARPVLAVHAS